MLILKEMCEGHFEHQNICRVLDVCLERGVVATPEGEILVSIVYYAILYIQLISLPVFFFLSYW